MAASLAPEQLPMTPGYFRLILRTFGDTPERRAALLAGTGLTEAAARDPRADISLFQQARQIENVGELFGEGWAVLAPDLWTPSAHGPLGVAALAAPDIAAMVEVLTGFAHVRAPFYELSCERDGDCTALIYELTGHLDERRWRPMVEISFISIRALLGAILGGSPDGVVCEFACAAPAHADHVRAVLGPEVTYGRPRNIIRFPTAWLGRESPFADPTLFDVAMHELRIARQRISAPGGLRGRVVRLLAGLPSGRPSANEAARMLGVSRRTLVRRLAEEGVGYRELVESELRRRSDRLLTGGAMSRTQIAEALGYADPTSLSRARRRWSRRGGGASQD